LSVVKPTWERGLPRPRGEPGKPAQRYRLPMRARAAEEPASDQALVGVDQIRDARARLAGVLRATPVDRSDSLTALAGRPVVLKPEYLQRTGSFKIRGAYNRISRLPPGVPVVAASAGNHAQGVALAARLTGRKATIFMPVNAPLPKVEATLGYGAEVQVEQEAVDDCIAVAQRFAAERGAVFVPPFDDPLIIAGQGTIGLELAEEAPEAEVVVVPVGGGGLIAGIAAALAAVRPQVRVLGVEAAGAASMRASLDAGGCVRLDRLQTMADGIALKSPSPRTLAHVQAHVEDVVTVGEEETSQALLLLLERAKAVVEPSGGVALAALLGGRVPGSGPVALVLSGGNIDPMLLTRVIDHGLSAAGRYVALRVVLADRPGTLARLTGEVGRLGLNVLSVEQHREGLDLAVDEVEVRLTLETRNAIHRDQIVADLEAFGYRVEPIR
jgi:threonine dehydratase